MLGLEQWVELCNLANSITKLGPFVLLTKKICKALSGEKGAGERERGKT